MLQTDDTKKKEGGGGTVRPGKKLGTDGICAPHWLDAGTGTGSCRDTWVMERTATRKSRKHATVCGFPCRNALHDPSMNFMQNRPCACGISVKIAASTSKDDHKSLRRYACTKFAGTKNRMHHLVLQSSLHHQSPPTRDLIQFPSIYYPSVFFLSTSRKKGGAKGKQRKRIGRRLQGHSARSILRLMMPCHRLRQIVRDCSTCSTEFVYH